MKKFFCSLLVLALCFALLPASAFADTELSDGAILSGTVEGNQTLAVSDGVSYTVTLDNATVKGSLSFVNPSSGRGDVTLKVKGNCVIEGGETTVSDGSKKHVGIVMYGANLLLDFEDGATLTIRGNDSVYDTDEYVIPSVINLDPNISTISDKEHILLAMGAVLTPIPEEAPIPETGDGMGLFVFAGLALISMLGMVAMKKREQN